MEVFPNKERTQFIALAVNQIINAFLFEKRDEEQPDEATIYFAQEYRENVDIIFELDMIKGYIFKIHYNDSSIDVTYVENGEEQKTIHLKLESTLSHSFNDIECRLLCFFHGHVGHFLKEDDVTYNGRLYPEQEEFIKAFSKE